MHLFILSEEGGSGGEEEVRYERMHNFERFSFI